MENENKKEMVVTNNIGFADTSYSFIENLGFDEEHIKELELLPKEAIELLNEERETVIRNISYLKDLGVSNYQEAFLRFYNMFLMEPHYFEEIFSKYDKDDLIAKLEKNVAIMEYL